MKLKIDITKAKQIPPPVGFVILCIPLKDGFAFNFFSKKGIKTFIETKVTLKDKVINNISMKKLS